jgi:Alpha/beta hydrolase family
VKVVFQDPTFSSQLLRTMSATYYKGADIGECLSTAYRIKEGDFERWYIEWLKTAKRVHKYADDCLAADHKVSAREACLKYYRAAEFLLISPEDPRIQTTWGSSKECFSNAGKLFSPPMELYTFAAAPALERGYNCLTFEGPGQGGIIRKQKIPFRYDWEKVVTPVIDYALTRDRDIDPNKIALMGISMGGYLAARAAAFEDRIAACVLYNGVYDGYDAFASGFPQSLRIAVENGNENVVNTVTEI